MASKFKWPENLNIRFGDVEVKFMDRKNFMELIWETHSSGDTPKNAWDDALNGYGFCYYRNSSIIICTEYPCEYRNHGGIFSYTEEPEALPPEELLSTLIHEFLHYVAENYVIFNLHEEAAIELLSCEVTKLFLALGMEPKEYKKVRGEK